MHRIAGISFALKLEAFGFGMVLGFSMREPPTPPPFERLAWSMGRILHRYADKDRAQDSAYQHCSKKKPDGVLYQPLCIFIVALLVLGIFILRAYWQRSRASLRGPLSIREQSLILRSPVTKASWPKYRKLVCHWGKI